MKVFIAGASGATGRLLVARLLQTGHQVIALVRSNENLPTELQPHPSLTLEVGSILDIPDSKLTEMLVNCDSVACCLGHNLSLRGIFGPPHRLVRDAVQRMCECISRIAATHHIRFVLMNTAGNSNRDLDEKISRMQKLVISLIRHAVPPHANNEQAADYLRVVIGRKHERIEWTVVRPDSLIDETCVSKYEAFPSPTRSAIFDPGKTSRINVAHFMSQLLTDDTCWQKWCGQMPVMYNVT
jgi:putative NADH-flavin reductase